MYERASAPRVEREMQLTVRQKSFGRCWSGFGAILYDASDGYNEAFFANHCVTMIAGAPVSIASRCAELKDSRMQLRGDIKVIPAGFSASWEAAGGTSVLSVHLSRELVRAKAEELGLDPDRTMLVPTLHARDPQIEHVCWALKAELEADDPIGRVYADSLGSALAAHLLRRYASTRSVRAVGLPKRGLAAVVDYVDENLARDLSLATLAHVANLGTTRFKQLFRQSVGLPVHQYIIRRRVERAIDLILHGDLPLAEIAMLAGFSTQSHLARCVRRIAGVTPGVLRRD